SRPDDENFHAASLLATPARPTAPPEPRDQAPGPIVRFPRPPPQGDGNREILTFLSRDCAECVTFFGRGCASSMGSDKHALEAPPYSAAPVDVVRMPGGREERDQVAVEEPLEIRIGGRPVAVTMRTPGHDEELALGFCLSEGLQPRAAAPPADLAANTIEVEAPGFDPARVARSFYTSSSCGVCGKGALEAVSVEAPRVERRLPDHGCGRRPVEPRARARGRPRPHPLRLRPRRAAQRLHRSVARSGLTGILLVGGASSRFGSPKALAQLNGETLAERAWRTLGETAGGRIAVGKQRDRLTLPFPVLDDGSKTRAALAGLVAGLRAAPTELCVVLPVDTPLVT